MTASVNVGNDVPDGSFSIGNADGSGTITCTVSGHSATCTGSIVIPEHHGADYVTSFTATYRGFSQTKALAVNWGGDAFGAECSGPTKDTPISFTLGDYRPKVTQIAVTKSGDCTVPAPVLTIGGVTKGMTALSGGYGFSEVHDYAGQAFTITVGGTTISSGTVSYTTVTDGTPEFGYTTYDIATISATYTCPSPTPTPVPSATATPAFSPPPNSTPPHPDGPPRPPSSPGAPNQSVNGSGKGVIVENPNDFYEPVRKAIEDAGNGSQPDIGSGSSGEPYPITDDDRGHVEDLQAKADRFTEKTDTLRTGVKDKLDKFKAMFDKLPKNIGTVSTINWSSATGAFGHQYSDAGVINLNDWQSQISLLRELLKWVLYIGFAVMTLRAFGWQH